MTATAEGRAGAGRRAGLALLSLVAVAAVLRAVHLVQVWNDPSFLSPLIDAGSYWRWAHRIAAGEVVGRVAFFQEPFYPYLLGALYALTGVVGEASIRLVAVLQSLLGVLSVPLAYAVARRLFGDRRTPLIAAALFALYQPFLCFEGLLEKENLTITMGLLLLLALLWARTRRAAAFVLPGVLMGWLSLVRGNDLLLVPCVTLAVALDARRLSHGLGASLLRATLFLAGAALGIAPATLHNALATGDFVPTTTQAGSSFYNCNCLANTSGMSTSSAGPLIRQVPENEAFDYAREAERRLGIPLLSITPGQTSRFWFLQSLREIAADPGRFARAERNKALMLLNAYEPPDNYMIAFEARFASVLALDPVRFGLVAPLAVAGTWWLLRSGRRAPFVLLLGWGYLATLLLFVVTARYRLPALPFLLLLGSYGLSHVLAQRSLRNALRLLPPLAAGALLAWPPWNPVDDAVRAKDLAVRHRNYANSLSDRGAQADALAEMDAALALDPLSRTLRASHAQILASQGSPQAERAAAAELDALLADNPQDVNALRLRGVLAIKAGDDVLAVELLGRARALRPWDGDIIGYLAQALYNRREVEAAIAELREATVVDPDFAPSWFTLAVILFREGRLDEGRAAAREFAQRGGRVPPEYAELFRS